MARTAGGDRLFNRFNFPFSGPPADNLYMKCSYRFDRFSFAVYDASGYYSGSIYAGNNIRRGNPQLCRELNNELAVDNAKKLSQPKTMFEEVQDFMILAQFLPFSVQLVNAKYKTDIESAPFSTNTIYQTVCMPKSCTHEDLMQVMSFSNVPHLRNSLIMKNAELIDVKILNENYQFPNDSMSYYLL